MMTIVDNPETGHEREVVNPDSFSYVESTPVTLLQFLTAVPRGLQETAQIIFFIFIVGGAMAVVNETKAIEAGMGRLIKTFKSKSWIIIPVAMFFFSICGSVFGMAEETLPFIPIFVGLMIAAGYDSITGTAVVLPGAGAGSCRSIYQPVHDPGCPGYGPGGDPLRNGIQDCYVHMYADPYRGVCSPLCFKS